MPNRSIQRKMSDSSPCFFSYTKNLRFFARIRLFLQSMTSRKSCLASDLFDKPKTGEGKEERRDGEVEGGIEDGSFALQRSVKLLHFGDCKEKDFAASEIKRLAKEDLKTRKSLAALGVIPTLVSMLDSKILEQRRLAIQALIELANGTYTNKALMVEAGVLSRLPQLVLTLDASSKQEFAVLLFSLSSITSTQFPIPSLEFLPFLVNVLNSEVNDETKATCLATLYNFSTILDHAGALVSSGAVATLLKLSLEKESSERALATLGNLVVTVAGKKAMENDSVVPKGFIDIMTWEEKPRCQELAAYVLMILAHRSRVQREKMVKLGVVPVLLEVALLGTPLAQKRALRILQWYKDGRTMKVGAHSGPQTGRLLPSLPVNEKETLEGRIAIKKMVKQSLNKNMELIMKRANAQSNDYKLKGLVVSSSSKSLPY